MKKPNTSIIAYNYMAWYNTCMSLGYELTIEQTQKLSMTPELIQAIQILQYNGEELSEYIKNELLENPLLEIDFEQESTKDPNNDTEELDTIDSDQRERILENSNIDIDSLREQIADNSYNYDSFRQWENSDAQEDFSYERYVSFRYSLIEHLLLQLQFADFDEKHAEIGRFLVHNIDDNGYLAVSTEEIAGIMNAEKDDVEKTLHIIQSFDPIGVGARTLSECLKIQLEEMECLNEEMEYILEERLEDIAGNRISQLAKDMGKTQTEIQEIADLIKSLEPKPGRGYDSNQTVKYVIPDVVVEKNGDKYRVDTYDSGMPKLMVSSYYTAIKGELSSDHELSKYLNERMNSALWLIRSIEQRNQTIKNVATAIVDYQKDFFERGEHYLKPLTLKQIAEEVGVHESTVSRAVNGKYMQTMRGVLEMKYFFTSGVKSDDGSDLSSSSIKAKIKEIINSEDPRKPFSDQKIVEMLNDEGIDISRRTVAKYRDNIGILPSSRRKRY